MQSLVRTGKWHHRKQRSHSAVTSEDRQVTSQETKVTQCSHYWGQASDITGNKGHTVQSLVRTGKWHHRKQRSHSAVTSEDRQVTSQETKVTQCSHYWGQASDITGNKGHTVQSLVRTGKWHHRKQRSHSAVTSEDRQVTSQETKVTQFSH